MVDIDLKIVSFYIWLHEFEFPFSKATALFPNFQCCFFEHCIFLQFKMLFVHFVEYVLALIVEQNNINFTIESLIHLVTKFTGYIIGASIEFIVW